MNTTTTIEKMIDSIAAVCIDLGLRGGYTPEEITDLVCDIAFAHMYILPRHEALHIVQSRLLAGDGGVAEGLRQDGQILIAPFFEAFVIAARVQRGYQVSHAPGNDQAAALIKAIGPG